jgi:transcriptional regulator with XRE-family HTH domain
VNYIHIEEFVFMNTGERLKLIREKIGISGKALAKKVDVVPSQISKIENGVTNPSIDLLERICVALGITMAEFFSDPTSVVKESPATYDEKIKNLPEQAKKIIDTVIEVNQSNKEQAAASGK